MAWTDLSGVFTYGSQLTSTQQQNLRDNAVYLKDLHNVAFSQCTRAFNNNTTYAKYHFAPIKLTESMNTLRVRMLCGVDNVSGTASFNISLYDIDSNTYSIEETTNVLYTDIDIIDFYMDVSTFSPGWGHIFIESKISNSSYYWYLLSVNAYWDVTS